jgi:hypothetical protein
VRLSPDIHSLAEALKFLVAFAALFPQPENPRPACLLREIAAAQCTKFCHPPVDALHSIENKPDKVARF